MSKIVLSAFADEYSPEVREQIKVLRENGIGYLEPRNVDNKNISELTEEEAVALKALLDENGVKISSIGSPLGKINLADDFEAHLVKCENVFKIANILGTKYVRIFSFYLRPDQTREDARDEVIEKLGRMLDLADKYGVILCHENEGNIYGESVEHCHDLLTTFGGRLRCVFDMGNFVLKRHNPYPYGYDMLKEYIEYFHIKDATSTRSIVPPGCGEACIKEILTAYKNEFNRDFMITLEPHLHAFAGLDKHATVKFNTPYKFDTLQDAFIGAIKCINEIVESI